MRILSKSGCLTSGKHVRPTEVMKEVPKLSPRSIDLALRTVQKDFKITKGSFRSTLCRKSPNTGRIPKIALFHAQIHDLDEHYYSRQIFRRSPRLMNQGSLFLFSNRAGKLHAVQGRSFKSLSKGKVRYITIAIDRNPSSHVWHG